MCGVCLNAVMYAVENVKYHMRHLEKSISNTSQQQQEQQQWEQLLNL